jgi:hypothetical protein
MLEIRCLENLLHYRTPAGRQSGGGLHLWVWVRAVCRFWYRRSPVRPQRIVGLVTIDTTGGVTRRKRPLAGPRQTNRDLM